MSSREKCKPGWKFGYDFSPQLFWCKQVLLIKYFAMGNAFTRDDVKYLLVIFEQKAAVLSLYKKFSTQCLLVTFRRLLNDLNYVGEFFFHHRR